MEGWLFNSFKVDIFLDSGSRPYNYISANTSKKLQEMGTTLYKKEITGTLLNGTSFSSPGYYDISLTTAPDCTIKCRAYVLKDLPVDIVLGRETMLRYNLQIANRDDDQKLTENFGLLSLQEGEDEDWPEAFPIRDGDTTAAGGDTASNSKLIGKGGFDYRTLFPSLFDDDKSGAKGLPKMELKLKPGITTPPAAMRLPARRFALAEQAAIDEQLQQLQEDGIIEKCHPDDVSAWSQILLVRKPNGSYRFCIDYRARNMTTASAEWPLPKISELIESLSHNSMYGKIDLKSAYHQLELSKEAADLTIFRTSEAFFRWKRTPFGLAQAPAIFQYYMSEIILRGLTSGRNAICKVYLDDIVIFAKDLESFRTNVAIVFERLHNYNIKVSQEKCEFEKEEIEYLGVVVSGVSKSIAPKTRESLMRLERPSTVTNLRSYLGLANYARAFLEGYAHKAAILQDMAAGRQKNAKLTWTPEAIEAFDSIKKTVQNAKQLQFIRDEGDLILYTDASDYACGGVLMQIQDGVEKPIEYFSKTFSKVQRRWSVTDKEMFGVLTGVKMAHFYIAGRHCTVRTDHRALPFQTRPSQSAKVERWKLLLQEYNITYEYIAGDTNLQADAMSRLTATETEIEATAFLATFDGRPIIEKFHGRNLLHMGPKPTMKMMREAGHFWRNMKRDVEDFCRTCPWCQVYKGSPPDSRGAHFSTNSSEPGEVFALDVKYFYIDADDPSGYQYLLIASDMFSRYMYATPIKALNSDAGEVAVAIEMLIRENPKISTIWTDRGREFVNRKIERLLEYYNIKGFLTAPAWKELNGQIEAAVKTVSDQVNIMRAEIAFEGQTVRWYEILQRVVNALNNKPHSTTGVAPRALHKPTGEIEQFAIDRIKKKFQLLQNKINAATIMYEKGDEVLIHIKDRKKLSQDQRRWRGPFQVMESNGITVSYIDDNCEVKTTHISKVKKFHRRKNLTLDTNTKASSAFFARASVHGWNTEDVQVINKITTDTDAIFTLKICDYPPTNFYLSQNPELKFL
jgi:hypothetical protein